MKNLISRILGDGSERIPTAGDSSSRIPQIDSLEPRILFSAAPVEAPVEEDAGQQAAEESVTVTPEAAQNAAAALESAESAQEGLVADSTLSGQSGLPAGQTVNLVNLNPGVEEVHRETLEAVAEAAAERWRATGLTAEQSAALDRIEYVVEDLGGTHLGFAEGNRITLDDNAAGNLWFIDPTPLVDEEYTAESDTLLSANSGTFAWGKTDLLTVILHEQGNILGLEDVQAGTGNLMLGVLGYNDRVLPAEGQADGAVLGAVESSYLDSGVTGAGQAFDNVQPSLGINYIVNVSGGTFPSPGGAGDTFLGEVRQFGGNFAPGGWEFANGQLVTISSNTALFSLFGTTYGGDGESTFALPDLRGRAAVHVGQGIALGESIGTDEVTLTEAQLAAHTHTTTEANTGSTGGGQAFDNVQPSLGINYIVNVFGGTFPSPGGAGDTFLGEIRQFGGNFAPGGWEFANGQLVTISSNTALFSLFGTTYGGDGESTFALPDLRGRAAVHVGQEIALGESVGTDEVTLTEAQLAAHTHTTTGGDSGSTGGGQAFDNRQASLAVNYIVNVFGGTFPSPGGAGNTFLGEVRQFGGNFAPGGWEFANGQLVTISSNTALFSIFGTTYGGDGESTFALPDLRGRTAVHVGQGIALGESVGAEDVTLTEAQLAAHSHELPVPTDTTAPTVTSILRQTPAAETTNADQVTFRVTFDEDVQNVDVADFALSGTAAGDGTIGAPSAVTGTSVYDVTITGLTSSDGTINLDFAGGQNIEDIAGNALANTTPGSEEDYTIDNTAPAVTSILRQTPMDATTNADQVTFRVTFDEDVQNVDVADFSLSGAAAGDGTIGAPSAVTGTSVYDVVVTGLTSSNGTINLDFAGGQNIEDLVGNALANTSPGSENDFTLDNTATVAITEPISTNGSINAAEDDSVSATGTTTGIEDGRTVTISASDGSNPAVTGTTSVSGNAFTVTGLDLSGLDEGSLTFSASVSDLAGNAATDTATAVLDQTATVAITEPISADGVINAAEDDSVSVAGTTAGIEDGRTVTISASDGSNPAVTGTASVSSNAFTVAGLDLSGLDEGSLTFSASVSDLAGNAATDTATAVLDQTATVAITEPISADGVINAAEDDSVSVAGTTAGIEDGRTVTISVSDGANPAVTGTASVSGNAFTVTGLDLSGLDEGSLTFSASVSDLAGNAAADTASAVLDQTATVAITEPISTDGRINATEDDSVSVAGTTAGIEDGRTVTISVSDGANPAVTGTASVSSNAFTVTGLDLSGLDEGSLTFSASVSDLAGNAANDTASAVLDQTATVAITEPISADGRINATEDDSVSVAGTTAGIEDGRTVTISASDGSNPAVTGTASVSSNAFTVAGLDLSGLDEGSLTFSASVSDLAGNAAADTATAVLDRTGPATTITGPAGPFVNLDPFDVTIDFGEAVTGFLQGEVTVANGSVTGFTDNTGGSFTVEITPAAAGNVTVDVGSGVADDPAGNGNTAAGQFSVAISLGPTPNSASVSGTDLTINGGGGSDDVTISSDGTNLRINTPGDTILQGAGTTTESGTNDVIVPVAGLTSITLKTGEEDDIINIGDLTNFDGDLKIDGEGGQDTINQTGDIVLTGASTVMYTGEKISMTTGSSLATDSGDVMMSGTGATGNATGVKLNGAAITSNTGDVNLTGQGGDTGHYNQGVGLLPDLIGAVSSTITTGGEINLVGTGGTSGVFGGGVVIKGSALTSNGSEAVTITGGGTGGSYFNEGVAIQTGSTIDAGTGDLTITGTGSAEGNLNRGIHAFGAELKSDGGNIVLNGQGGGPLLGVGADLNGVDVSTTGTGTVILTGSGSPGTLLNFGVKLSNSTDISAVDGEIKIEGTANGTDGIAVNHGVQLVSSTQIRSTGIGPVTISGSGGAGVNTHGVDLATGIGITVNDGALTITGTGRGSLSKGVNLGSATLTGNGSGNILVTGTSNGTGTGNVGVSGSSATLTTNTASGTGSVTIKGTGSTAAGATSGNDGVNLSSGTIQTGGNGAIDIDGTGGGTTTGNRGVYLGGTIGVTVSGTGGIDIDGTGRNTGIELGGSSNLTVNGGNLNLTGTGGAGSLVKGVKLSGATLTGNGSGNLTVKGTSNGTGTGNVGVSGSSATLTTNTASGTGSVTIKGTGSGSGSSGNDGVNLTNGKIETGGNGAIDIDGIGGGTTTGNRGIYLGGGIDVTAGGTGAITIDGTGGAGTNSNDGIQFSNAQVISSGTVTIFGTGNPGTSGYLNRGVYIYLASVMDGGAGSAITGTGGGGTHSNHGVNILNTATSNIPLGSINGTVVSGGLAKTGTFFT